MSQIDFVSEFKKCKEDPVYFAKNYIKIINVDEGLVPFKMWQFQEKLIKNFHKNRFKYSDQLKRDEKKLRFCEVNKIKLAEVYPEDKITASLFDDQEIYL